MSKENIKKIELGLTILLFSIATIVSFNKAIPLFFAIVFIRMIVSWILYKKTVYETNAKKEFYSDLIGNVLLLFWIIFVYIKFK